MSKNQACGGAEKQLVVDNVAVNAQSQGSTVPVTNLEEVSDSGDDASQSGSGSDGVPKVSGFGQKEDDDELPSSHSSGSDERHEIDYMAKQKGNFLLVLLLLAR